MNRFTEVHDASILRRMEAPESLLLINGLTSWALLGLIWLVQHVQYPLLARVPDDFVRAHALHTRRITVVVAPLMVIELMTSIAIAIGPRTSHVSGSAAALGLALVLVAWGSTVFVQVPLHARLSSGFDAALLGRLVRTNWLRTVAWTGKAILSLTWLMASTPS